MTPIRIEDKVHNGGILLDSLNSVTKSESSIYRIPMQFSGSDSFK